PIIMIMSKSRVAKPGELITLTQKSRSDARRDAERLVRLLNLRISDATDLESYVDAEIRFIRSQAMPRDLGSTFTQREFDSYQAENELAMRRFMFRYAGACRSILCDYADGWIECNYEADKWRFRSNIQRIMSGEVLLSSWRGRPVFIFTHGKEEK